MQWYTLVCNILIDYIANVSKHLVDIFVIGHILLIMSTIYMHMCDLFLWYYMPICCLERDQDDKNYIIGK